MISALEGTIRPTGRCAGRSPLPHGRSPRRRSRCRWRFSSRPACFTRSLFNVSHVDLGLKVDNVVTFRVSPALNGYTSERSLALFERLEDELAAVPGVTGVSGSLVPLLSDSSWGNNVSVEGFEAGPDTDTNSRYNAVGPDYFRTLGISLLAGREFTRADAAGAPKVAIVNEQFAKKFNLGRDAVGKRMGRRRDKILDMEIVGLVKDTKYSEVKEPVPPSSSCLTGRSRTSNLSRSTFARRSIPSSCFPPCPDSWPASTRTSRSRNCGPCRSRCGRTCSLIDSSPCCRQASPPWRRCSRPWGCTACSPTRWPSGRGKSACGWRSAPRRTASAAWSWGRWAV